MLDIDSRKPAHARGPTAMVAILPQKLTFEEFLNWDDGSGRSFELINGVAMPLSEPTAKHEDVVDGLCRLLIDHCQSFNLPYVPRQSKQVRLNSAPGEPESSRKADIVVFDKEEWDRMRQSSASAAAYIPPPLVIEVVSTNWRDDDRIKLNEYETLGIFEYWIVDYAGLGGVQYIGSPKQPTLTINRLIEGNTKPNSIKGTHPFIHPPFHSSSWRFPNY